MWRKLLALLFLGVGTMTFWVPAAAQAPIVLSGMLVQLWPEYDQPSMLVLYDFQVAPGTKLPTSLTIRIPKAANLTAVAVHGAGDALLNADYSNSSSDEAWQSIAIQIVSTDGYRVEYVQPLVRSGNERQFTYSWPGDYAVQNFNLSVRMPIDAASVRATPSLQTGEKDSTTYWLGQDFDAMPGGKEFKFELAYTRASESPAQPQQGLEPSQPLDAGTPGRVMIGNYIPYFLGALGVLLIAGGILYFWQAGRGRPSRQTLHRPSPQRTSRACRRDLLPRVWDPRLSPATDFAGYAGRDCGPLNDGD